MHFGSGERIALDVGEGVPVLCLHGSLGASKQWRGLAIKLVSRYRVLAVDLLGYAGAEEWPVEQPLSLTDELSPLLEVIHKLRQPVHLVGHSFGGAVALRFALHYPELVRSLILFEPVNFSLLLEKEHAAASTNELRGYADTVVLLTQQGAWHAAGRCFVDYWTRRGHWDSQTPERQSQMARKMPKVAAEWGALFTDRLRDDELGALRMPITLMCGMNTATPALRVTRLLNRFLPQATAYFIPEVGHMGPFTHTEQFNRTVARVLDDTAADRSWCAAA